MALRSALLWLGALLVVPAGLVLLVALSMAQHSPSDALVQAVGPALLAAALGSGMLWLASWGCPQCQRVLCAQEVSQRDLGTQTASSTELRDGRWVRVTKTQRKVRVTLSCRKCGHRWSRERSRTLRERTGGW